MRKIIARGKFNASLKKPAKTFWQNEASLVWDWISREFVCLDANQQRASWDWFMMKQAEWHRDFQERLRIQRERYDAERKAREAARKHKWESLIEPFERNGYTVTPLLTTEELTEEGKEMHHCVAGYSASCEDGLSRIFSIKQGEKRVSTLELVKNRYDAREGFNWSISQHRGPTNLAVTEELDKLAQHIKSRYNKAYDKWEKEQAENKQLESKEKVEVEVAPVVEAPRQLELLNDVF